MPDLDQLNRLEPSAFVSAITPAFERSSWIAERAWSKRPFSNLADLHAALCDAVRAASVEKQLELIRAHPDLAGQTVLAGAVTPASKSEQASAGLDQLSSVEIEKFRSHNEAYRAKFGFPFVICARLNKKEAVLEGFQTRLLHTREQEIKTALEEIYKIAYLRLRDIVHP